MVTIPIQTTTMTKTELVLVMCAIKGTLNPGNELLEKVSCLPPKQ